MFARSHRGRVSGVRVRPLSEGVTLRRQPVHRRWLEPLLASSLSTGAGFEKEFVCNRGTLGSVGCSSTSATPSSQSVHRLPIAHHARATPAARRTCACGERIVDTCPGDKRARTGPRTGECVCNLKSVWVCMLLVHERLSARSLSTALHGCTHARPMSTSGIFLPPLKEKICREIRSCAGATPTA